MQEAFLAAWSGLPSLSDPAAFPGWLRGIVRHQAFARFGAGSSRSFLLKRRRTSQVRTLYRMTNWTSTTRPSRPGCYCGTPADPAGAGGAVLRPWCSHQDIANFLGISVTTVNNRLHVARVKLKERMTTMVAETLQAHGLPDDFANRIGRLVAARGEVIEALFDPHSLPEMLTELAVSDEANRQTG